MVDFTHKRKDVDADGRETSTDISVREPQARACAAGRSSPPTDLVDG